MSKPTLNWFVCFCLNVVMLCLHCIFKTCGNNVNNKNNTLQTYVVTQMKKKAGTTKTVSKRMGKEGDNRADTM